jgi:diguanylate cyclase (GGDEF)-like protein
MSGPTETMQAQASAAPAHLDALEAVMRVLPIGVAVHDENGQLIFANAAMSKPAAIGGTEVSVTGPGGERTLIENAGTVHGRHGTYRMSTSFDITERRQVENELFRRAYLDELTDLPNRRLIEQTVEELIAGAGEDTSFALAFIDVDNFKHINDYYSHSVGDAVLAKIAQRISGVLRKADMLARVGGDEFVLLISPVHDVQDLADDIAQLVERLKQPFGVDGHEIFSSASIGVSVYPQHGRSYDVLRRNADSAMYRSKAGVKGCAAFFDETMGRAATARMEVEQRLRLAIRDRRFCCVFQPKTDIRTHEISGVEVLLRWRDEAGLIQAPGDFINLAIELGLIDEIAHLVLAETVRVMDRIDDVFGKGISISLNVAAKQAGDLAFMRSYTDALAATGRSERFMIELTEEAFFAKSLFQTQVLPLLRTIGTRVSIDDFGVGYSSLSALADITVDEVKVDRSFITDIHQRARSQSVLKAIESLSHALGMTIVAEGVETFEELAYLQAATRIRHAQGYYFARPLLLEEIASARTTSHGFRSHAPARSIAAARG